ncbi:DUF732 domain-containing protein [Cryobacterium arcticum]|uniref:DUF732 domain-containing protein n=1 Tax=Cryobacterium arcticum TaxID=670052 RepID=A0A1B1BPT6_9MICO|nr:DUF732 domain-containing protein [Cryobacterium arcticum]ANP74548.1 hypothetical protein PA27867_3630 [Cryobacterium arcticum]
MFKIGKLAGFAAVAVLALSGCSAAGAGAGADVARSEAPEVAAITAPTESATPVAESGEAEDGEARFLRSMHNGSVADLLGATDPELLAAGHLACAQMTNGTAIDSVDVIQGDVPGEQNPGWTDRSLAGIASETLCVEFDQTAN